MSVLNPKIESTSPLNWRGEFALWITLLLAAALVSAPLIAQSAARARPASRAPAAPLAQSEVDSRLAVGTVVGSAVLDLKAYARADMVGADNLRWALIRRTPQAEKVYQPEQGLDRQVLGSLAGTGDIYLPAGFAWSFRECFVSGPGYISAQPGIPPGLEVLASLFRAAAAPAGLTITTTLNDGQIPDLGSLPLVDLTAPQQDLVIRNHLPKDLFFIWNLTPETLQITLSMAGHNGPLPPLPDWRQATVVMVYGRPGPGGWGSLGLTTTVDQALFRVRAYGQRLANWPGMDKVVVAVNPNVATHGDVNLDPLYLGNLIAEARRQGIFVMLDVQTGEQPPQPLFASLIERYLLENVWLDWDLEHTIPGTIEASVINQVSRQYFEGRRARGYATPGIFAFYVFSLDQVVHPEDIQRNNMNGMVVPIFDGFGGRSDNAAQDKIHKTSQVIEAFGEGPFGIMEFETRWGTRFDQIDAHSYFQAFPMVTIFVSQ